MTASGIPDAHTLPASADRIKLGAGVGGVALLLLAIVLKGDGWAHFLRAYLFAFVFVASITLGSLFFIIIQHATRAGWSVTVRRIAEFTSSNFLWLWILFLPILIIVMLGQGGVLYDWMDPASRDAMLEHKAAYLNSGFWIGRTILYLGLWAGFGWFFFRHSTAQDRDGNVEHTHRMQAIAPIGALLYALTQTYAAIDWIMSLSPHWFSTMFGVYFFAASCCGFFSALILAIYFLQRSGRLLNEVTLEHYQDLGKLLFAFGTVFWAYIGFSQFMLIWYGNIPEETTWYMARATGPWEPVSYLLLVGHFIVPFLLLVTKHTKRVKPVLAGIAAWMLLMHLVDCYWLVMPIIPSAELVAAPTTGVFETDVTKAELGFAPAISDLLAVLGVAGIYVAGTIHRMTGHALAPTGDPRLGEALAFENM